MTYSIPVKNQETQRNRTPEALDPAYEEAGEFDGLGMEESDGDRFFAGKGTPGSLQDLQYRIQQLKVQLASGVVPKELQGSLKNKIFQIEGLIAGMTPGQRLSHLDTLETRLSGIEEQILGFDEGMDLPAAAGGAEGSEGEGMENSLSEKSIDEVLKSLENGDRSPTEESKLTLDDCKQKLNQAKAHLDMGQTEQASELYEEVLDALGGEMKPEEILAEQYGESPSKVDKDTLLFDGKEQTSLDLKAAGKGKTCVAPDVESITITPSDKKAEAKITVEGEFYVIQIGSDTFKVNKEADIRIFCDKVTGDINNSEGKVKVGADEKTERRFLNPEKSAKFAETLRNALGKIGERVMGVDYNVGWGGTQRMGPREEDQPNITYGVQGFFNPTNEPEEVKRVLNAMAEAAQETDPKKQKEAWEDALDVLTRIKTDFDPGAANNRVQLLFNVLHGELGEKGLKDALKTGLIPKDFASELATILEGKPDENTKKAGEIDGYQIGGPGWTHSTSAEFLKKHSKKSQEENDK